MRTFSNFTKRCFMKVHLVKKKAIENFEQKNARSRTSF